MCKDRQTCRIEKKASSWFGAVPKTTRRIHNCGKKVGLHDEYSHMTNSHRSFKESLSSANALRDALTVLVKAHAAFFVGRIEIVSDRFEQMLSLISITAKGGQKGCLGKRRHVQLPN